MDDNIDLQQAYIDMLRTSAVLQMVPINPDILVAAAKLRAKFSFIRKCTNCSI